MSTETSPVDVRNFSVHELLDLFGTLEAPAIADLHGEYDASLLRQPSLVATVTSHALLSTPILPWRCKAFRPIDAETGRGYNTFGLGRRVVQRFPMHTRLAPSRYDGKAAYHLIYGAYDSLCGRVHMVDEVRRLSARTYLGIGTWGFTEAQRRIPQPFLLEGPVAEYRGDIGEPRRSFVVGRREIPALAR